MRHLANNLRRSLAYSGLVMGFISIGLRDFVFLTNLCQ